MEAHPSQIIPNINGETQPPICPLCGVEKEDDDHPYKCNNPKMKDAHKEALDTLKQKLKAFGTYPLMIEVINHYLKHWMRGLTPDYTH